MLNRTCTTTNIEFACANMEFGVHPYHKSLTTIRIDTIAIENIELAS